MHRGRGVPASRCGTGRVSGSDVTILHVLAPAAEGGLERVVAMLVTAQRAAGQDARAVAVLDREGAHPFVERLAASDIPVSTLVMPGRDYLAERRALARLAASRPRVVVHTHGYRPDVIAASAARAVARPTVSTVHGFTGGGWRNRLYERVQQRALRRADAVVAVATTVAGRLAGAGVSSRRLFTVPNAFEPYADLLPRAEAREALGIAPRATQFGWVGRVSPEKGADVLVAALPFVDAPDVGVSVVGDGPARGAAMAQAERLGVASRLTWHGMLPGAGRYLLAFDALVLSSRTEGTPVVLLEAMAAGVPVVATAVGGVPEMLPEGHGLLVPTEQPAALAAAMGRVLRDPAAARARAALARARVGRDYAVAPWVAAYDDVYRSVLRHAS